LQKQTITTGTVGTATIRTLSHESVCWTGGNGCSQFGWYLELPGKNEQIIFDPIISPDGELVVSTFIPNQEDNLSCASSLPTGWTIGFQPDTGAGSPIPFFFVNNSVNADAIQLNGTGIPSFVMSGQAADMNAEYLLTQTSSGDAAKAARVNRHAIVVGQRLNWIERR
jgi:type IV pilus assembly protein PilY1